MRRKFFISSSIIPLLFLLLLGGCLGPDYLVTSIGPSEPGDRDLEFGEASNE